MRRASKSICVNIAEGSAKQHFSNFEFSRFLNIALGSSEEMREWLKFSRELGYLNSDQFNLWHNEYDEISKMLYGLMKRLKSQKAA